MRVIDDFLQHWGEDSPEVKALFSELYDFLRGAAKKNPGLTLDWRGRPGVSHSLLMSASKTAAANETAAAGGTSAECPCIARLDVIDDDPEERWLSLYLDAELAEDPDGRGEILPRGLNGRDALCFDIDENDEEIAAYLRQALNQTILKTKI